MTKAEKITIRYSQPASYGFDEAHKAVDDLKNSELSHLPFGIGNGYFVTEVDTPAEAISIVSTLVTIGINAAVDFSS